MRSIKKFLVISLCLLCWHCSCDNKISDEVTVEKSADETKNREEEQIVPILKTENADFSDENVNIQSEKMTRKGQSDTSKQKNLHGVEKKKMLSHADVKVSKFSDQLRKMRRKDITIGPMNIKRKSKSTSISDNDDTKIKASKQNSQIHTDTVISDETVSDVPKTEVELSGKESDIVQPPMQSTSDETAGSQSTVVGAKPKDEPAKVIQPSESVLQGQEVPDHGQHPHSEAMPSFDEWKKMMLAEQEKGGHKVPSPGPPGKKISSQKRRRNYSSYECGAKIVASNAEAEGTSRILNERVDEYMLNPCKAKIWFVIELCETVQASQIELANFELFSSCPKDFAVSSSDNFPTRDWVPLGTYTAAEQRVLQSFQLKSEGFSKFIKVEFLSHYGKEHYCPLNVVRIFGTSMVDEYEEMEKMSDDHSVPDDELDRLDIPVEDKSSSNLFGSATDAVYNIVKKAAQVLGQQTIEVESSDNVIEQNTSEADHFTLVDDSCSKANKNFSEPIVTEVVVSSDTLHHSLYNHLRHCDQCVTASRHSYYSVALPQCRFFQAAFGPVAYKNICDWFKDHLLITLQKAPVIESVQNDTGKSQKPPSPPPAVISVVIDKESSPETLPSYSDMDSSLLPAGDTSSQDNKLPSGTKVEEYIVTVTEKVTKPAIQPTKTFPASEDSSSIELSGTLKTELPSENDFSEPADVLKEDPNKVLLPSADKAPMKTEETFTPTATVSVDIIATTVSSNATLKKPESDDKTELGYEDALALEMETVGVDVGSVEPGVRELNGDIKTDEMKLDSRDLPVRMDPVVVGSATFSASQKESVFVRMNNRIKALELNMSLSSQYLQELSQRYRRQMEEMQRAFNRTIGTLNDTAKKAAERDLKQQEVIGNLQSQVANLTEAVDQLVERHIFLMVAEAIVMITIMSLCVRRISSSVPAHLQSPVQSSAVSRPSRSDMKRRNSAGSCSPPSMKRVKKRSSSDEGLLTGEELLIVEPLIPIIVEPPPKPKKKHKKKKQMQRSSSNPVMSPTKESPSTTDIKIQAKSDETCAAGIIFSHSSQGSDGRDHWCENCDRDSAKNCKSKRNRSSEKRTNSFPLKNLTNGVEHEPYNFQPSLKGKDKFSFRKFLKFQKRESI